MLDFLKVEDTFCNCSLSKKSSQKRVNLDITGTGKKILVLLAFKRSPAIESKFLKYLTACGLPEDKYSIGYSLGCSPYAEEVTESIPFKQCAKFNIGKRIKEFAPTMILCENSSLKTLLEGANINVTSFHVRSPFKTYFWLPEYRCWVFPFSDVNRIVGVSKRESYSKKEPDEKILENFSSFFLNEQVKKVTKYLSRPLVGLNESYNSVYVEDPNAFLRKHMDVPAFSYDIETTGLTYFRDKIFCLLLAFDNHTGYYLDWKKVDPELLSQFFVGKRAYAANFKFDAKFLRHNGVKNAFCTFDVNYAGHILYSTRSNGLKENTYYHTGLGGYDNDLDIFKKKYDIQNYKDIPFDTMLKYACGDAVLTFRLHDILSPLMDDAQREYFLNVYMPVAHIAVNMEMRGILIDVDYLKEYRKGLEVEILGIEKELLKLVEERLELANRRLSEPVVLTNLSSPDVIRDLFIRGLKAKAVLQTDSGQDSVDDQCLKNWSLDSDEIISGAAQLMLKHRFNSKLISSYLSDGTKRSNLISDVDDEEETNVFGEIVEEERKKGKQRNTTILRNIDENNVVHSSFNFQRVAVFRWSCNNPNLQQIPIKSNPKIRPIFRARPGYYLAEADFSGFHLRIMAMMSDDASLCEMFKSPDKSKRDMHSRTGATVFTNLSFEDFQYKRKKGSKEEIALLGLYRDLSKRLNFSCLYGAVATSIAKTCLMLPPPEGWSMEFMENYFNNHVRCIFDRYETSLQKGKIDEKTAKFFSCSEVVRDKFFDEYAGVAQFIEDQRAFAKTHGYVTSLFGTKVYLNQLLYDKCEEEESHYANLMNDAVNWPVITTESNIMQKAMIRLDNHFKKTKVDAHIVNQIHDSVLIEFPIKEAGSSLGQDIHDIMVMDFPEYKGVALDAESFYFSTYWGGHPDKNHPEAKKLWFE